MEDSGCLRRTRNAGEADGYRNRRKRWQWPLFSYSISVGGVARGRGKQTVLSVSFLEGELSRRENGVAGVEAKVLGMCVTQRVAVSSCISLRDKGGEAGFDHEEEGACRGDADWKKDGRMAFTLVVEVGWRPFDRSHGPHVFFRDQVAG